MAYAQNDPLENLDSKNNQKKKTRSQHLKDYAAMMTKKGMKPYEYEFSEYMKKINDEIIDTTYHQDIKGQLYRKVEKGGSWPFYLGEILEHVKVDSIPKTKTKTKTKKKKGGM